MEKSRYFEHPDVIELCSECDRDACPSDGCQQYKDLISKLRKKDAEEKKKPKPSDYTPKKTPELLQLVSNAITALDALGANRDCNAVYPQAKIIRLCSEIEMARFNAYNANIDWDDIAQRMEEKR